MSIKPENQFISGVHAHLKDVYFEKMANPFRSGTADVWYSGMMGDAWIEYKYVPLIPKTANVSVNVSERQRAWLLDRFVEGRRVYVIVGCPQGGMVVHPHNLGVTYSPDEFRRRLQSRKQLADWIREQTGTSPCRTPKLSSLPPKSPRPSIG